MQAATSGIRNVWRNAACVILFNGPFRYNGSLDAAMRFGESLPNCLETIPGSKDPTASAEILFVQRHSKSGFMANTHVFPGGVLDEADYSMKWLDLFSSSSARPFSPFSSLGQPPHQPTLPLYSTVPPSGPIVGEVAFRICAIREMFEETGVLLARDKDGIDSCVDLYPGSFSPAVKVLSESVREEWRKRVSSDAHEFVTMCRELQCVPDIWSLIERSDWLTPRNHKRRYDTVFYMCFVENRPPAAPDFSEVTSVKWMSPSQAEELFFSGEILLAPPQFAELRELQAFSSAPCLHSYALSNCCNTVRKLSTRMLTKDKVLMSVTQRDDLYPLEGAEDTSTKVQHPQAPHLRDTVALLLTEKTRYEFDLPTHTAQELRELSRAFSRMEFRGSLDFEFTDPEVTASILDYIDRYREQVERVSSKL